MATGSNNNRLINIFIGFAFLSLVFLGIKLIIQTDNIYDQSFQQSNQITQKLFDTSFKKSITIPAPSYNSIKEGYSQALSFFTLALGALFLLLLLPRLQNLSISPAGINVTLKEIQSDVEHLKTQNNILQENMVDTGGGRQITDDALQGINLKVVENKIEKLKKATNSDDPQKGVWGEQPEANGRRLSAIVTSSPVPTLYRVRLKVESIDSNFPLKGFVTFHLHPTFKNDNPTIAVRNGIAELKLNWVYGAFTVGAEADDGKTKLELDLSQLPGITDEFKNN